ncbi:hypothetical protein [Corynebacterium kalidii]
MTHQLPPRGLTQKQKRIRRRDERFKTQLADGAWHAWPVRLKPATASNLAWRINRGHRLGDGYEAHVRQGTLYVRKAQQ